MARSRVKRRVVRTTGRPAPGSKVWAWGYADFAVLFGMSEAAVRQRVKRGAFDPSDLESVFEFWQRRRERSLSKPTGQENSLPLTGLNDHIELL
jgi:hypothetical protein